MSHEGCAPRAAQPPRNHPATNPLPPRPHTAHTRANQRTNNGPTTVLQARSTHAPHTHARPAPTSFVRAVTLVVNALCLEGMARELEPEYNVMDAAEPLLATYGRYRRRDASREPFCRLASFAPRVPFATRVPCAVARGEQRALSQPNGATRRWRALVRACAADWSAVFRITPRRAGCLAQSSVGCCR